MNNWEEFGISSSRRLIVASFAVAILLSSLPLPQAYFFWLPDWVGMVLLFWVINRPSGVNLGVAFVVGLLLDMLGNTPLGMHSAAYLAATFLVLYRRQRIVMFGFGTQALIIGATLLVAQLVIAALWAYITRRFIGWSFLMSPLSAALLWPLLNKLMLNISSLRRRTS